MAELRFNTLSDEEMTPDQRRVAKAIKDSPRNGIRGPFPALLRRPEMADATRLLGDCVRYGSSLSDKIRELAILIVVRHWNVDAEWISHSALARQAGIAEGILEELEAGHRPFGLAADEAVVYDLCRALLDRRKLGDAEYQAAIEAFGEVGVVDLIGAVAYYNYISVIMNAVTGPSAGGVQRLVRLG